MPTNRYNQVQEGFDNSSGGSPIEWLMTVPFELYLNRDGWYDTGRLDLMLCVDIYLKWGTEPQDARYLNPTKYRAGTLNLMRDDYLVQDNLISYKQQSYRYKIPTINVTNSWQRMPTTLRRTTESEYDHAYSLVDAPICGVIDPQPVAGVPQFLSATLPGGAICMRVTKGEEEYDQIQRHTYNNDIVTIPLQTLDVPLTIKGILQPGFYLGVDNYIAINEIDSEAVASPVALPIVGPASFPVFGYTCASGQPVPLPSNPGCAPFDIQTSFHIGTGVPLSACPSLPVP